MNFAKKVVIPEKIGIIGKNRNADGLHMLAFDHGLVIYGRLIQGKNRINKPCLSVVSSYLHHARQSSDP